jgi:hypothetical protein
MTNAPLPRREPARCPPRARGRPAPEGDPVRLGLFALVLFTAVFAMAVCVVAAPVQALECADAPDLAPSISVGSPT